MPMDNYEEKGWERDDLLGKNSSAKRGIQTDEKPQKSEHPVSDPEKQDELFILRGDSL